MKKFQLRQKLLSVLLILALLIGVTGCGKKTDVSGKTVLPDEISGDTLNRGEYIYLLGTQFGIQYHEENDLITDVTATNPYYNEIQSCADWQVIEQGKLDPEKAATLEFALESAVKAIGIDEINQSTSPSVNENNLTEYYVTNIAQIDISDLEQNVSIDTAKSIIAYACQYASNLEYEQVCDLAYAENVITVMQENIQFRGDGVSARVLDNADYTVGDVLYIPATENSIAQAVKITEIDGNLITYVNAEIEEVFTDIQIHGTYDANIINVIPESDQIAYRLPEETGVISCGLTDQNMLLQQDQMYSVLDTGFNVSGNSVEFTKKLKTIKYEKTENGEHGTETLQAEASGELKIGISNMKVTADVDWSWLTLKKCKVKVTYDDIVAVNLEGSVGLTIPLGKVIVQIGPSPCTVVLSMEAFVGAEGEVELKYTANVVGTATYEKGKGFKSNIDNQNPKLDLHAQVTLTAEMTPTVDLQLLGTSLVNMQVTTGAVAVVTVDVDILGNQPTCTDVYIYVPLRWGINQKNSLLYSLWKKSRQEYTVWDSTNSQITMRYHIEDGEFVDECTRGEEAVETSETDETGQPYDEYTFFDFEVLDDGFIELASYLMILGQDESLQIGISELPTGYSKEDLLYSVQDTSICTVTDQGLITAVSGGSTVVRVATIDDQYAVFVTVTVEAEYNDMEGFQPL